MTSIVIAPRPSLMRRGARRVAPAYRWVCSRRLVRRKLAPWLSGFDIDDFSPDGRGLGPDYGIRRIARGGILEGATVLVLGVGRGAEIESYWLNQGAAQVIGADLSCHQEDWSALSCAAAADGTPVNFALMDGGAVGLRDNSVDVVFSQSVLEHVLDVDAFLAESTRVLADDGWFYAYFGPLWSTYGGSHVSALEYDHLLMEPGDYLAAAREVGDGWEHWLEAGLFNHLRFADYLELLDKHLHIERVGVVASKQGGAFRQRDPDTWARLLRDHDEQDLLVNLVSVIGRPKRRSR